MTFQEAARLGQEAAPREMWLTHYSPSLTRPEEYLRRSEIFPKAIENMARGRIWSMELGFDEEKSRESLRILKLMMKDT